MTNTLTSNVPTRSTTLDIDMLERFRQRAAELDRTNSYFHEDLADLQSVGYLAAAVPVHHGGWGLDLGTLAREQRRLARFAGSSDFMVG